MSRVDLQLTMLVVVCFALATIFGAAGWTDAAVAPAAIGLLVVGLTAWDKIIDYRNDRKADQ